MTTVKVIADLYGDQFPEVIVASKEKLTALNYRSHDQTLLEVWSFADYECREMPMVILSDVIPGGTTEIVLSDDGNIYILGADIEDPPPLSGKDRGWSYIFFHDKSGTGVYPHAPSRPIPQVNFVLKMQIDASELGKVRLTGDVNGDGYLEMIAAKGEKISVISHEGKILWQQEYPNDNDRGVYVTALEDILGSGDPEILADVSENGRPKLLIIDGSTGDVINSILTGPEAKDGLISNLVNGISVDNDGNVWFGTTGGVSRFDGESWISYRDSGDLANRKVSDVFADQSNNVWFGTVSGVTRYDLSWQHPRSFRSRAEIDILQADDQNAVWSGTRGDGIVKYEDGKAIAYPQWSGINQVTAMAVDRKRNALWTSLWTNGNEPGLIRISIDTGQIASMMDWKNSQLVSNRITALTMAEDGSLWLGTSPHRSIVGSERMSGLNRYNPDTDSWESWPFLIPDPNVPGSFMTNEPGIPGSVASLLLTDSGILWIGTRDDGIRRFDTTAPGKQAWTEFKITDGLASNSINAIAATPDGAIWFATPGGASKYDEEVEQWQTFTTADGLGGSIVNDLKTVGNVIWLATNGGVSRHDDENWLSYDTGDGLASNNILSVAVDKKNTLWVGTSDGLVQARRSETVPPDTFITVHPGEEERVEDVAFEYLGGDLGTGLPHILYQHKLVPEGTPPEETRWSEYTRLTQESFAGLTQGMYTFYVRATDRDANVDPTPASWTFTIDLIKKHGRNEIPDHDLLKTAYFITSDDHVIKHWVSQKFPSLDGNSYEKAKAAFEILGKNVCCLPRTDWEVLYPRDLLRLKVGNLYDCAILYAAILERLEVPVALVLTPEDAIVLFESDVSQQCIELNNGSWVTVCPQFDLTFDAACQLGLSSYRKCQEGEFTLLDVRKEQRRYKPVQMEQPLELYLERGVIYGQRRQYDDAIEQFEAVLKIQENNAAAHNNLGNIYALKAKHSDDESRLENAKKAEEYYDSAAKLDLDDAYTFLNRGIAFYLQGKKEDALIAFRIARFRGKLTFEEACRCMGIDPGDDQYGDIEKLLAEAMNGQLITRAEGSQVISDALPLYWKLH